MRELLGSHTDIICHARYGINDIRTLVGHKTDMAQVKAAAAVRLEKGL
jgi:phenylalanyl-tRNA synthetase alpha chain